MLHYYNPVSRDVLELRNPRFRFFFFGPFYLLWLRLWLDAAITAVIVWLTVHGAVTLVSAGGIGRADMEGVLAAFRALQAAADRGVPADDAFRELVARMLPFYVAAFTVVIVMATMTYWTPRYLDWRYRRRGYRPLVEEDPDEADVSASGMF